MRAGVIVAGGRSTRFGDADKAVAELAGTPMVRRVADQIASVVDRLVVNCRTDQVPAIEVALSGYDRPVAFAEDREPDRGPMAGIATGLRAAPGKYAFVVACDMPFVEPGLVRHLFDRADGRDAAVPRPGEWFQPTHAVYRARAMADACEAALARGDDRIVDALFDLDYVVVGADEIDEHTAGDPFRNCNTREEFEAAAADLS